MWAPFACVVPCPQVSLTIHQQSSPDTYTDWAMLFVDTSASDTLTHLTLPCVLDLELVHILQVSCVLCVRVVALCAAS